MAVGSRAPSREWQGHALPSQGLRQQRTHGRGQPGPGGEDGPGRRWLIMGQWKSLEVRGEKGKHRAILGGKPQESWGGGSHRAMQAEWEGVEGAPPVACTVGGWWHTKRQAQGSWCPTVSVGHTCRCHVTHRDGSSA